jgi:hypothetical protein
MKRLKRIKKLRVVFIGWLIPALIITLFSGFIYMMTQQQIRLAANDPQIQMAEDEAIDLANGKPLKMSTAKIDIAQYQTLFLMVFDNSEKVITSSGLLNNQIPTVPPGIFKYVKLHNEERFTWEPLSKVRIAAVMVHYDGLKPGFLLVGRSLREVEKTETQLFYLTGLFWLGSLLITFLMMAFSKKYFSPAKKSSK